MINFYDIAKNELDLKPYEAGSMYCCTDSEEIFLDSISSGNRIQISSGVKICASSLPLAPIPELLYVVIKTGTIHAYIEGEWVNLSDRPQLHFKNIIVPGKGENTTGSLTIENARILETDTAVFVPDLSIIDLVETTTISVTCSSGSVTITSNSIYDLPGVVIVN